MRVQRKRRLQEVRKTRLPFTQGPDELSCISKGDYQKSDDWEFSRDTHHGVLKSNRDSRISQLGFGSNMER